MEDWPDDSPELNPEFRPVRTSLTNRLSYPLRLHECFIKVIQLMNDAFLFVQVWKIQTPTRVDAGKRRIVLLFSNVGFS